MPKLDWVHLVDRALSTADRAMDRLRRTPRKRLAKVPEPKVPNDPFGPKPAEPVPTPTERPLGDPGLAVQVYGRRTCDASGRAIQLLQARSIPARLIDMEDPDHRDLEARLIRETKSYKTPYVYLRGVYAGSYAELAELERSGMLGPKLEGSKTGG